MSIQLYSDYNVSDNVTKNLKGEPQEPPGGFSKIMTLMKIKKLAQQERNSAV